MKKIDDIYFKLNKLDVQEVNNRFTEYDIDIDQIK